MDQTKEFIGKVVLGVTAKQEEEARQYIKDDIVELIKNGTLEIEMTEVNNDEVVGYNGLSESESEVIALAVRNGFRSGMVEGLIWKINIENEEHDELLNIVQLLEEGYTSGYYPTWQLKFNRK